MTRHYPEVGQSVTEDGRFKFQARCGCGWRGPWREAAYDDYVADVDAHRLAEADNAGHQEIGV
jgi:hypothetical protein